VGFCNTDVPALAALHLGEWCEKPVRKRWGEVYRRFDAVAAPSRYLAERLQDAGVQSVEVAPLGVDTHVFRPERADRARVRAALGVRPDERLLVFAGRPAAEKRIGAIVEAVERLGRGWRLLLVGAGAAATAAAHAVSDRVVMLPYQNDAVRLARLLASCDAFVHANPTEALGLIVLEAMACGLPVVGVAGGGVSETVDEEVGRLAQGPDAGSLARAVSELFEEDQAPLRARARERVLRDYGWDRTFEALSALYARLTGDQGFLAGAPADGGEAPEAARDAWPDALPAV
jgi:alpha-1,6-mannosyltransferase